MGPRIGPKSAWAARGRQGPARRPPGALLGPIFGHFPTPREVIFEPPGDQFFSFEGIEIPHGLGLYFCGSGLKVLGFRSEIVGFSSGVLGFSSGTLGFLPRVLALRFGVLGFGSGVFGFRSGS